MPVDFAENDEVKKAQKRRLIGERIRQRRKLMRMSQKQLAAAAKVSFQQIQKYEKGISDIPLSRLQLMVDAFQVPISYFDEDESTPRMRGFAESGQAMFDDAPLVRPAASLPADIMNRDETIDLVSAYYRVTDPKKRKTIMGVIKDMADKAE